MSDGDGSEGEGNEGEEELQVAHERPGDSGEPAMRSRSYDALFFLGVIVVVLIFVAVVFWLKP